MNHLLKRTSLDILRGKWWQLIGMVILCVGFTLIPAYIGPGDGMLSLKWDGLAILLLFLLAPAITGWEWMILDVVRGNSPSVRTMFQPFGDMYLRYVRVNMLLIVFTLLWTLLFVVPGIIKGLAYSLTPYLLFDRPDLRPLEAITESRRLMAGHKWRAFKLILSFIGWWLLVLLTLGLAILYVQPYFSSAYAQFYLQILGQEDKYFDEK